MRGLSWCALSLCVAFAAAGSYDEILKEDALGLSPLKKSAAEFLRALEHKRGAPFSREELRKIFASKVPELTALQSESGPVQIKAIREWVISVAPVLHADANEFSDHLPLNKVLEKACGILGVEAYQDGVEHPHRKAKELVGKMREFTQAVIEAFNRRNEKQEL